MCQQFDEAVTKFGLHVESKLSEMDDKGKLKHTLSELLSDGSQVKSGHRLVGNMPGMDTIIVDE